ncbi:MAG: LamG domain-containing protein [Bacteroidetes bacterium]|nr:LamG domain-containing protein [Bacteroidota bacterium]
MISNPVLPASGIQSATSLADSAWYFLVGVWDSTGLHSLYINGVLDTSQIFPAFNTINNSSTTDLRIGTEDSTYRAFKGKIDDVRIYNRPLSAQEVMILWNEGASSSVSISATSSTICQGESISFTATSSSGGSNPVYEWMINGQVTGTNNAVYTGSSWTSGDIVSCTMRSSDPCVQPEIALSNTIQITVIPAIPQSVSITSDFNVVCPGQYVTFKASPDNGSLLPSFQWKINGFSVGNDTGILSLLH